MKPPFEALTPHSCSDQTPEVISPASRTGARLLIVDDEITQRNMLAVIVEQAGMACETVPGGREALASLQTQAFDAVIADLNMPGYSGMELLTEVRRHYPQMVFLMATGVDDARMGVEAMRRGADDYLIKPLQIEVIMVSLDRAFRQKNLEKEVERYRLGLEELHPRDGAAAPDQNEVLGLEVANIQVPGEADRGTVGTELCAQVHQL